MAKSKSDQTNRSRQLNQQKGSKGSDRVNAQVQGNRSKQLLQSKPTNGGV